MSAASDAEENEQRRQSRTEAAIAANDSSEQGGAKPAVKKKVKKKVVEKGSTAGASNKEINAGAERLMQPLRIKLRTAVLAGNTTFADKMRQRLLALQSTKI